MSSRNKQRVNYREDSPSQEPLQTLKITKHMCWFGLQYQRGKKFIFQNNYQFFILSINEFEFKNNPILICDIITKKGVVRHAMINKSDIPFEWWISAIKGYEKALLKLQWLTEKEINKYKINKNYTPTFKKNDRVWHIPIIFNDESTKQTYPKLPLCVKARILQVEPHIYIGELCPEYKIQVYNARNTKYKIQGGWVSSIQIFINYPTAEQHCQYEDVIIENILKCRKYGLYCLLDPSERPPYCDPRSAYYCKREQWVQERADDHCMKEQNVINEINYVLNKSFGQTIKTSALAVDIKLRCTKLNLFRYCTFVPEFRLDDDYKEYLSSTHKVEFSYHPKYIAFTIPLEKLQIVLERTDVISKSDVDGSEIKVISDLVFKWIRNSSELMLWKYTYSHHNHHVVMMNENETDDEDEDEAEQQFNEEMEDMI